MAKGVKIGITGLPESGKTSALKKVIEMLEEEELVIGGMVTEPVFSKNKRTGYQILDWMTKKRGKLMTPDPEANDRDECNANNLETLRSVGVSAIEKATDEADVIVIDEVGRLEVECEEFVDAVKRALDANKPLLLTLHKKSRNPLLQDIRRRDDVRILEVTQVNQKLLPYKIIRLLKERP